MLQTFHILTTQKSFMVVLLHCIYTKQLCCDAANLTLIWQIKQRHKKSFYFFAINSCHPVWKKKLITYSKHETRSTKTYNNSACGNKIILEYLHFLVKI